MVEDLGKQKAVDLPSRACTDAHAVRAMSQAFASLNSATVIARGLPKKLPERVRIRIHMIIRLS